GEAAGGLDLVDVCRDDLADGRKVGWEEGYQAGPVFILRQHGPACNIEAEDIVRAVVGAEHEGGASVLQEVGGGLVATAGDVQVGDLAGGDHTKAVAAFW